MVSLPEAVYAYLERDGERNLMLLGAMAYDPVQAYLGAERDGRLAAAALVVDLAANLPDDRPTVMVAADDPAALAQLVGGEAWPEKAIWSTGRPELLAELERLLGRRSDPARGLRYYIASQAPSHQIARVRRITMDDADELDLSPCALSPTALRSWLRRGWRMFGAVQGNTLLCHALAAYPIADTEEVSAVFTAPRARRRGLARAVVATTIADIVRRGSRAVYVTSKTNVASQRVAEALRLAPLQETWEVVIG